MSGTVTVTRALDAVVVLCGGASRRMGQDKALARLGDASLLERATAAASLAAPRVLLATGTAERYGEIARENGREVVLDRTADGGPLAGIEAALACLARGSEAETGAWLGILAVDMPFASAEVLERCAARAEREGLDAVFLATERGVEPLCGAVHTRALPAVTAALARGERRAIAYHAELAVGTIGLDELPAHVAAARPDVNVNTPGDLAGLEETAIKRGPATPVQEDRS